MMHHGCKNGNNFNQSKLQVIEKMLHWTLVIIMVFQQLKTTAAAKYKGDTCMTKNQAGICKGWGECPIMKTLIESGEYSIREVINCGFDIREELICCPIRAEMKNGSDDSDNDRFGNTNSANEPNPKPNADRPAVEACRRIESALQGGLTPHILGGTPVEWGEYPHMAAIGYSRVGGDGRPPYDIRCGGTLIDKRFVLTAAHCVAGPESTPSIVRLGVVDFNNANQMKDAVEVRINKTHFPEEYHPGLSYNDIAVLELEREVEYTEYIYPACLYTDLKDPDADVKLWVSGWGTINTTTRSVSDILLKAPLHIAPLDACNQSFVDNILNRRLPQGIKRTQLCAEDKDQIKDSCQGDSGGPLILIVDETIKNYRLVGVVSSGISCASSTPGLYTRVAAFLDFIEKIVWPRKGN